MAISRVLPRPAIKRRAGRFGAAVRNVAFTQPTHAVVQAASIIAGLYVAEKLIVPGEAAVQVSPAVKIATNLFVGIASIYISNRSSSALGAGVGLGLGVGLIYLGAKDGLALAGAKIPELGICA